MPFDGVALQQWRIAAPRRLARSAAGLGRANNPERLERVDRPPPKLRMAKSGFAATVAGRSVRENTIPVRKRPIGVIHTTRVKGG